jgi:citrate lyase subunit beta/citryl-CoA lyase
MSVMRPIVAPLFVPGDRPERFQRAAGSGADAVIIDIEDAVSPDDKAAARANAATHGISGVPVLIRINAAGSAWFEADLAMLRAAPPDGVILAKADSAAVVAQIVAACPQTAVIPLVETVAGLASLAVLLQAPGILCAAFGSLDYAADLGSTPDWEPLLLARSEVVLRSRLAGIAAPIDGVTPNVEDVALTETEARRARAMGFGGKLAIHPRQIAAIQAAFRPSEAERAWAAEVLAAVAADPRGALRVAGALVDKPVIERAQRIAAAA